MNPTSKTVTAMPENNKGTTYSFDVCAQCKIICCIDAKPPLTENRKKIIKAYLEEQKISVVEPFTKKEYSYPSVDQVDLCIFNSMKTKKCMVHSVKPETCVSGPITFDINFKTKKIEWFLKKSVICAYADVLFNDKAAFQQHFEVAKKQITQLIQQLGADELRALMKIDEPETLKIGEDPLPADVVKKLGL
jgi:uncharacterized protein